jgi:hypothetical protein
MKIWEPKAPGTLWATPGLLRDDFTFTRDVQILTQILREISSKTSDLSKLKSSEKTGCCIGHWDIKSDV